MGWPKREADDRRVEPAPPGAPRSLSLCVPVASERTPGARSRSMRSLAQPVSLSGARNASGCNPGPPAGCRLAQLRNWLGRLLNKSTLGVLAVDLAADPAVIVGAAFIVLQRTAGEPGGTGPAANLLGVREAAGGGQRPRPWVAGQLQPAEPLGHSLEPVGPPGTPLENPARSISKEPE